LGTSVANRKFATFLSHAHADLDRVLRLREWFRKADIPVWFDKEEMPPAAPIATGLAHGIGECRSIAILLTKASVASNWVREEFESGMIQRTDDRAFKILPILLEDCEVPQALRSTSAIDARHGDLDSGIALGIIRGLYGSAFSTVSRDDRDVYVAAGWREEEFAVTKRVLKPISDANWRPIGDAKDQQGFGEGDRVKGIMKSCGALVAVLGDRGNGVASPYIIREIGMAGQLNIPVFIFRDPKVDFEASIKSAEPKLAESGLAQTDFKDLTHYTLDDAFFGAGIKHVAADIEERFRKPERPHYAFLSYKFRRDAAEKAAFEHAKQLISGISCIPCADGDDIPENVISKVIIKLIGGCFFQIADVTADNINSCIEAGIGMGAGINLHLISEGERTGKDRPFMFRDRKVEDYETSADLIAMLHKVVRRYRRRDLSQEIL
jgi:hypothetical protein